MCCLPGKEFSAYMKYFSEFTFTVKLPAENQNRVVKSNTSIKTVHEKKIQSIKERALLSFVPPRSAIARGVSDGFCAASAQFTASSWFRKTTGYGPPLRRQWAIRERWHASILTTVYCWPPPHRIATLYMRQWDLSAYVLRISDEVCAWFLCAKS